MNILPFWNVFGYVGKINVDAKVDAEYTGEIGRQLQDKLNNKLPGLGNAFCNELSALCNSGTLNVPLHLEYDLMGVGTTLSVGYNSSLLLLQVATQEQEWSEQISGATAS